MQPQSFVVCAHYLDTAELTERFDRWLYWARTHDTPTLRDFVYISVRVQLVVYFRIFFCAKFRALVRDGSIERAKRTFFRGLATLSQTPNRNSSVS